MATNTRELDIHDFRQLLYKVFPRDKDAVIKVDKLLRKTYWIAAHNAQATASDSTSQRIEEFFVQWISDGLSRCLSSLMDPKRLSGVMALDLFELVCERTALLEPALGSDAERASARPPIQAIERAVRAVFGEHYPAASWIYGRHADETVDPSMTPYEKYKHDKEMAERQEARRAEMIRRGIKVPGNERPNRKDRKRKDNKRMRVQRSRSHSRRRGKRAASAQRHAWVECPPQSSCPGKRAASVQRHAWVECPPQSPGPEDLSFEGEPDVSDADDF